MADLATSGAQAILRLLITDGWEAGKKLAIRIFSRGDSSEENVTSELETSKELVADAEGTTDTAIYQNELERWDLRLKLRLLEEPELAQNVQGLIDYGRGSDEYIAPLPHITIQAKASGNSRVYQQGSGVQHNG